MMFADVIEAAEQAPSRRPVYRAILGLIIATVFGLRCVQFFAIKGKSPHTDFDAFYIAANMAWTTHMAEAYRMAGFLPFQKSVIGSANNLAWTYPPPYNLVVAPLAALPLPAAFVVFMGASLLAWLWTLNRVAGPSFVTILILMLAPIYVVIIFGQNGFITGTLIGLACIGLRDRRAWAGIPLGLMIIKPHLAIGFAFYVLVSRQWRVMAVAAATVFVAIGAATLVFGVAIWPAFFGGIAETSAILQSGRYPLYRMLSPFAVLRSFEAPSSVAFAAQAIAAIAALAAIFVAHRRFAVPEALGLTAIASLLISPYVYDYDLPIMGIGLALLLPALLARGHAGERSAIYVLFLFMTGYGLARLALLDTKPKGAPELPWPPTVAGVAMIICAILVWRILDRERAGKRVEAIPQPVAQPAQ